MEILEIGNMARYNRDLQIVHTNSIRTFIRRRALAEHNKPLPNLKRLVFKGCPYQIKLEELPKLKILDLGIIMSRQEEDSYEKKSCEGPEREVVGSRTKWPADFGERVQGC